MMPWVYRTMLVRTLRQHRSAGMGKRPPRVRVAGLTTEGERMQHDPGDVVDDDADGTGTGSASDRG